MEPSVGLHVLTYALGALIVFVTASGTYLTARANKFVGESKITKDDLRQDLGALKKELAAERQLREEAQETMIKMIMPQQATFPTYDPDTVIGNLDALPGRTTAAGQSGRSDLPGNELGN